MQKEGIVSFIVFRDNKNIWFGEKFKSFYLNYWESYANFIDSMSAISEVIINLLDPPPPPSPTQLVLNNYLAFCARRNGH